MVRNCGNVSNNFSNIFFFVAVGTVAVVHFSAFLKVVIESLFIVLMLSFIKRHYCSASILVFAVGLANGIGKL